MRLVRRRGRGESHMSRMTSLVLPLALFALPVALASQGDRSPEYAACVRSCSEDACGPEEVDDGVIKSTRRLPLILRVTGWSCIDDCKYHCTHRLTNDAYARVKAIKADAAHIVASTPGAGQMTRGQRAAKTEELVATKLAALRPVEKQMVQYHGKWVFVRFLGAQEPLSVLFSLLNFRENMRVIAPLRKRTPDAFPLKLVYLVHAFIACNAWIWSTVFHWRDKDWTERMDYFSAGASVLSSLFFTISRLLLLTPGSPRFVLLLRISLAALACHILYLSFGRFDYAYNMKANLSVGFLHLILWTTYSLRPSLFPRSRNPGMPRTRVVGSLSAATPASPSHHGIVPSPSPPPPVSHALQPASSSRPARRQLQLLIIGTLLATSLELFDFPPFHRLLDAHALWHLATVPLTRAWWAFLLSDAEECVASAWWGSDDRLLTRTEQRANEVVRNAARQVSATTQWAAQRIPGLRSGAATPSLNITVPTLELGALTASLQRLSPFHPATNGGPIEKYDEDGEEEDRLKKEKRRSHAAELPRV